MILVHKEVDLDTNVDIEYSTSRCLGCNPVTTRTDTKTNALR